MRRRTAAICAAALFLVGLGVGLLLPRPGLSPAARPAVAAVIDAREPGTKVYHRGHLLGEVPLELTYDQLAAFGYPVSATPNARRLEPDGWGEALFAGREDEDEFKLMLQVPDAVADRYLDIETPWGRRTKMGPWDIGPRPNGRAATGVWDIGPRATGVTAVWAHFQPAQTPEGVRFRVHVPGRVTRPEKTATVELTCENAGREEVVCQRPSYTLRWGGPDTPWRHRTSAKDVPLPPEWERIRPGQTVRASFELDAPSVAGDYSVFAVLGCDRSYSNSALLRVR